MASQERESTPRKSAAVSFLRLVASGKVHEAYAAYIATGFRHHNAFFKGDAESLKTAMIEAAAANPTKSIEIHRAIEEGDLVAVYSHVRPNPDALGAAVVHIFRFEGERVVELWDVGMAVPVETPNENGLF